MCVCFGQESLTVDIGGATRWPRYLQVELSLALLSFIHTQQLGMALLKKTAEEEHLILKESKLSQDSLLLFWEEGNVSFSI